MFLYYFVYYLCLSVCHCTPNFSSLNDVIILLKGNQSEPWYIHNFIAKKAWLRIYIFNSTGYKKLKLYISSFSKWHKYLYRVLYRNHFSEIQFLLKQWQPKNVFINWLKHLTFYGSLFIDQSKLQNSRWQHIRSFLICFDMDVNCGLPSWSSVN